MFAVRNILRLTSRLSIPSAVKRGCAGSAIPVDDVVNGLTDDQIQLRQTVRKFFAEQLAPHADEIDKNNEFPAMREFWKQMGEMGLLGITAPCETAGGKTH